MTENNGFVHPNERLTGPANYAAWLLLITSILLALNLDEFMDPAPENQNQAAQRRWNLDVSSDHSKAYGYVVKNIANTAIQAEAITARRDRRPLHEFLASLHRLRRSEIEVAADIERLKWRDDDSISTFWQRGRTLYNEMNAAHPEALNEYSFLLRMLIKLPARYMDASRIITAGGSLGNGRPTLDRAIQYLMEIEAQERVAAEAGPSTSTARLSTSTAGPSTSFAGPSTSTVGGGISKPTPPVSNATDMAMLVTNAIRSSLGSFMNGRSGRGGRGGRGYRGGRYGGAYDSCKQPRGTRTCYICGSHDHLSPQCPDRDNGNRGSYDRYHPYRRGSHNNHNHHNNNRDNRDNHNHNHNHNHNRNRAIPHFPIHNSPHTLVAYLNGTSLFNDLNTTHYLLDSAATTHVTNNLAHMTNFIPLPHGRDDCVMTGAGPLKAKGYGNVRVMDEHNHTYNMTHVMYVPDCPVNLFSTIKFNNESGTFITSPTMATLHTNQATLRTTIKYKGIYALTITPPPLHEIHTTQAHGKSAGATQQIWHARFGHVGLQTLNRLLHGAFVNGIKLVGSLTQPFSCMSCNLGKFKKSPHPPQSEPIAPLSILHSDVCGPLPVGLNNHKYIVTVRDNCTGYTMTQTTCEKSDAPGFIKHCISFLERKTELKVKAVRLDKGGEFTSNALKEWLHDKGVQLQHTAIECSQSNGVAERVNLTIMDRLRATLAESNQPRLLWPWAVNHIVTALNYIPYNNASITPHEHLFKSRPDVSYLRAFGSKVITWVPTQEQPDKLVPRGVEGRLVGYIPESTSMYQVRLQMMP